MLKGDFMLNDTEEMRNLLIKLNVEFTNEARYYLNIKLKSGDTRWKEILVLDKQSEDRFILDRQKGFVEELNSNRDMERFAIEILKEITSAPLKFKKQGYLTEATKSKLDFGQYSLYTDNIYFKQEGTRYLRIFGTINNLRYDKVVRLETVKEGVFNICYNYLEILLTSIKPNITLDEYRETVVNIENLDQEQKILTRKIDTLKAKINI